MNWYLHCWKHYADFGGRAARPEYWWFYLWNTVAAFALAGVDTFLLGSGIATQGFGFLSGFYALAAIVPALAVTARRLHDTGRSGWWMLIAFVPLVGAIALFVFLVQDSKSPGAANFPQRTAA